MNGGEYTRVNQYIIKEKQGKNIGRKVRKRRQREREQKGI